MLNLVENRLYTSSFRVDWKHTFLKKEWNRHGNIAASSKKQDNSLPTIQVASYFDSNEEGFLETTLFKSEYVHFKMTIRNYRYVEIII